MTVLSKILSPKNRGLQFWFTVLGLFVGLFTSLLAIILMWDIYANTANQSEVFGDNTLVIQKHVSSFTSLGLNKTGFTPQEVVEIEKESFVLEVAPFKTANYEVGISENPGDGLPDFYAEMFLQSVPDSFLGDIDSASWHWENENDIVPIILPRDFLTIVNYGIAPSKGLPQISEELIKSVRLRLHLIGNSQKGIVLGRVVGFSSKISSVLVPESFIQYSNKRYGSSAAVLPNRLFIKTKAKSFAEITELAEKLNLDIAENDMSIAKATTYLLQMILLFFVFAFVIVVLALLGLLQYIQMKLMRFQYEVLLLIKLGYRQKIIIYEMRKQFLKLVILVAFIAVAAATIFKFAFIHPLFETMQIDYSYMGLVFGILFALIVILGCVFVLSKSVKATILKIYKKN